MADTVPASAPAAPTPSNNPINTTSASTTTTPNHNTNQAQQSSSQSTVPTTTHNKNPGANLASPSTGASANNENRGLPYYEKLRRELRDTLQKKRLMDKSMAQLEDQIFRFEQSYLEDTSAGNIIKGFDNYIKGSSGSSGLGGTGSLSMSSATGTGGTARRKAVVSDTDRVFSRSSASYMRDSPAPSSAQTTPSHAPTPTSSHGGPSSTSNAAGGNGGVGGTTTKSEGSKGGSSKNKKKSSTAASTPVATKDEDDADVEVGSGSSKPPAKRLKISYGRD